MTTSTRRPRAKGRMKVGYNLAAQGRADGGWALSPWCCNRSTLFGMLTPGPRRRIYASGCQVWLAIGIGGLLSAPSPVFIRDVETGLVWMTKILTDPFSDLSSTKGRSPS